MDTVKIGQKIKEIRKEKKFTQQELADKIGKTESSIRKYEKGLVEIPMGVLGQISDVLEISVYDLIYDSKELDKEVQEIEDSIILTKALFTHYNYRLEDCDEDDWKYYTGLIADYLDFIQYKHNKEQAK